MVAKILYKAVFGALLVLSVQVFKVEAKPIDSSRPSSYQIDQSTQLNFKHLRFTPEYLQRHRPMQSTDLVSPVSYHNGRVVLSHVAYTIFWDPNNTMGSGFRNLVNRYFKDVGRSDFLNIVSQYYQSPPMTFISSNSTLGGTYHDNRPYPEGRGTAANPLTDFDIQNEVSAAIIANSWASGGYGIAFFVFTAKGVESCADSNNCTPGTTHPTYCAYHGSFGTSANPILYANMPYAATWNSGYVGGSCYSSVYSSAPNELEADQEIGMASHEHFEIITNPTTFYDATGFNGGWYDSGGWEIADKCSYYYGAQAADGSNVTLNGNPYLVQREWSNADANGTWYAGCSISYKPDANLSPQHFIYLPLLSRR